MSEKKVTLVCCANNDEQLARLKNSLVNQTIEYEFLEVDNRGQKFPSCSKALNWALEQMENGNFPMTEFVIFTHQDIELPTEDTLEKFVDYMEKMGPGDILGVAGSVDADKISRNASAGSKSFGKEEHGLAEKLNASEGTILNFAHTTPRFAEAESYVLSKVSHGDSFHMAEAGELPFTGMVECDSLDECFFGGRTADFLEESFDEILCDNWHLYGVERELRARSLGHKVFVCDIPMCHYSIGHINHAYNAGFRNLAKAYSKSFDVLCTVCGSAKTSWFGRNLFYFKRELLFKLKRM